MRRWPTWLVVGALVALGAFAAADTLRGSSRTESRASTISVPLIPRNEPAASAMSGVLYYTDAGCVLRAVEMPTVNEVKAPRWRQCQFSMAPHDALLGDPRAIWSPEGSMYAVDTRKRITLASPASAETIAIQGHAPAFKPDGTFTYVRGQRVIEWSTECPPVSGLPTLTGDNSVTHCRRAFFNLDNVSPLVSPPGRIAQLMWLSKTRPAFVVRSDSGTPPVQTVAVFDGVRLAGASRRLTARSVVVEPSPRGSYYAIWVDGGLFGIWDFEGHRVLLPPITGVRALTWSPDERWTAAATAHSVFVFRTNEDEARVRRLPIEANDLAWR
jgi:hypothetical protein